MKKLFTILLVLCMFTSSALATAITEERQDTLDWKLSKQLSNGSGLRLNFKFSPENSLPETGLEEQAAMLITALTSGTELEINYLKAAIGAQKGREEFKLNLKQDSAILTSLIYRTDGILEMIKTPLLGKESYVSASGEAALLGSGGDWPEIGRLIFSIYSADNEWKTRLEQLIMPYQNDVANLIQQYSEISSKVEGEATFTLTDINIPASAIKAGMKELITKFFADEQLLTLLKQRATIREQHVYLNPEMLPAFESAIDALALDGNAKVNRTFTNEGVLIYDKLEFPMGGAKGLSKLSYLFTVDDGKGNTAIDLLFIDGTNKSLKYSSEMLASGKTSFVGEYASGIEGESIAFILDVKAQEPVHDKAADRYTQNYSLMLTLSPKGKDAHKIECDLSLSSGSNPRSATNIKGNISWKLEGAETAVSAQIEGASTPPWSIPQVDEGDFIRLEQMSEEDIKKLTESIQPNIMAMLAALTIRNMPAQTPNP
ncbi:MAG TPA: hypothetical protein GXZ91_07160 [Christensenellaceae bacterium]|jgi:hypothetical protein|nr:hypothetical protein [Christensenellaceae bacterium]